MGIKWVVAVALLGSIALTGCAKKEEPPAPVAPATSTDGQSKDPSTPSTSGQNMTPQ